MTQLTQHFTLAELTASGTAQRLGLDNTPPPEVLPALTNTAEMLERIRSTLGVPVVVTVHFPGKIGGNVDAVRAATTGAQ